MWIEASSHHFTKISTKNMRKRTVRTYRDENRRFTSFQRLNLLSYDKSMPRLVLRTIWCRFRSFLGRIGRIRVRFWRGRRGRPEKKEKEERKVSRSGSYELYVGVWVRSVGTRSSSCVCQAVRSRVGAPGSIQRSRGVLEIRIRPWVWMLGFLPADLSFYPFSWFCCCVYPSLCYLRLYAC